MRLAVLSDIHANLVALEAVLAEVAAEGITRILCLGDIVDLGPAPQATVTRLRELGCACVQGNHDPLDEETPVPLLAAVRDWTREQLDSETQDFLRTLPPTLTATVGDGAVCGVHGSPRSPHDPILAETPEATLEDWLSGVDSDVLACGHTHVQLLRRLGPRTIVNVGSVGMPFERTIGSGPPRVMPWAEYGVLAWRAGALDVSLRRCRYDFAAFERSVHESGIPDAETWLAHWVH